jgi:glucokinase
MVPATGVVSPLHIPSWRNFPLREFAERLTDLPVAVDNDAKALALAEGWCGAAVGVADFIGVVVGTGVGGGIVSGGRLLEGRLGNAGHVGHLVVEPDGRPCRCGGFGCLEAYCSGVAIEAETSRAPQRASTAIMERTGTLVGRALASVGAIVDLRLAVVGGSVALGFGATFFNSAQAALDRHAQLDFSRGARVTPARLEDRGPLIGAGAVGMRGLRRSARRTAQ